MITECLNYKRWPMPPQDNSRKAVAERWERLKPLYDATRNADEYERQREDLLSQRPEYQQ